MTFRKVIIIVVLILVSCKSSNLETQIGLQELELSKGKFPKQIGYVNDFEEIFTKKEIQFLENLLEYYKTTMNHDIAVITIDSIPKDLEFNQFAIELSDNWKVGSNNNGNGLTVVLSKSLKRIRITTTDRTRELFLSDEFCKKVIDEYMIPEFKNQNYYDGVLLGLNELIKKWT
ncbi:TPM domain-containing protein [Robertkochia aurantiaca]|uniref:TPM domain-containing protein n=1 Tax=Robertkochia aurantiaca TaxID=2873700 RepID=UPI001CCDD137|nr:TPM domain-containing protein [Robertkochia sp. 3YJGBD-33]